MADAWRRRGHISCLLFLEFEEIEIVTAGRILLGTSESFLGCAEARKTWGQGERILAAGDENSDFGGVHRDGDGRERRNRIDYQRDLRILREGATDFRQWV